MSAQRFVGDVLNGLGEALEPLTQALSSPEELAALVGELGWSVDPAQLSAALLEQSFGPVPEALVAVDGAVAALAAAGDDLPAVLKATADLAATIARVAAGLRGLRAPTGAPPPFDDPGFWASLGNDLLGLLVVRYLERRRPRLLGALRLAGIATADIEGGNGGGQAAHVQPRIHWDRLVTLASDPKRLFTDVYGWGGNLADVELIAALADLCALFGLPVDIAPPPAELLDLYWTADAPFRREVAQVSASLYRTVQDVGTAVALVSVSLVAMPIPPRPHPSAAGPAGFTVAPVVVGRATQTATLSEGVVLKLGGGFEVPGALRVEVLPTDAGVALPAPGRLDARAALVAEPPSPWVLLGRAGSTRVELVKAHLEIVARGQPPDAEAEIAAVADAARLVIDFGDADGFLQKVLGAKPLQFDFGAGLGWSSRSGFRFIGQATLDVTIAVHMSIFGLIDVKTIRVVAGADPAAQRTTLTIALTGGLNVGPARAVVQEVGLRARLEARPDAGKEGNLGDADFGFAFKPPTGAGLSLDAVVVRGGGFILLDDEKGLYAGVLRLEIQGIFAVTAIGLISTKMPDGSRGFSLLVIVAAELPAIQLSFGFTLNGIGGLLGANRTMNVDALRAGVRTRILDSILFPPNPVENAPKIIADLQNVFPIAPGRFVIGLMVRVGWGTPTLIKLDLGILLEVPAPIRVALLGRLSLALPEEPAIVSLKMDVVGILDFDRLEASVDATIYDSRIAVFTLTGDMAARLNVGTAPTFALSAGGFNPRFAPPPDFPALNRMAIALATGDNPRLRLEAYFATTPATVQFGARLEVFFQADLPIIGRLTAAGHLSFDALMQALPPSFVIDIAGGLCLRHNGKAVLDIQLALTLSGPTPWHACGEASFEFLGKRRFPCDITVGENVELPPLSLGDPLGDVLTALRDPGNWSGHLPHGTEGALATIRSLDPGLGPVLHPFGSLGVAQNVVPLALEVSRYEGVELPAPARFEITGVRFGMSEVGTGDEERRHYAAGEYLTLSEDERLSRPAFEPLPSGRAAIGFDASGGAAAAPVRFGTAVPRPDDPYDTIVVDAASPPQASREPYTAQAAVLDALVVTSAAALAPVRTTGVEGLSGPRTGIAASDPRYRIARREDLRPLDSVYGSFCEAAEAMAATDDPNALQVVGAHEVA